jgi:hypothetical protein
MQRSPKPNREISVGGADAAIARNARSGETEIIANALRHPGGIGERA